MNPSLSASACLWAALQLAQGEGRIREKFTLPGYSQGGVVVDGIAYFTADDAVPTGFPSVAAFDAQSGKAIRAYAFENTYDSSPLVLRNQAGRSLVLAHEWIYQRTRALHQDDGTLAWTSPENQPGSYFSGYSYYASRDKTLLVLTESDNGLHANSLEDGNEAWWVPRDGGRTPAVDQEAGWTYYQSTGRLDKI